MKTKTTLAEFKAMNSVRKMRILRKNAWCWVFMLPTVLLYILFQGLSHYYKCMVLFTGLVGMTMNATFVGLGNFKELLADPLFYNSVANSFKYMFLSVPIQLVLSLVIAYILTSIIPQGRTRVPDHVFYSGSYNSFHCGNYHDFHFRRNSCPVNQVLAMLGIDTINFLGDEKQRCLP